MLEINNLHVEVYGNSILRGVSLVIPPGETFVLFGPNGSGKTTLLMSVMGFSGYEITEGSIKYKGVDITHAPMYERARLGIGMSFQRPPTIRGLKLGGLLDLCAGPGGMANKDELASRLNLNQFLGRSVNDGFSGGEIKRSEMLQLLAQNPDLLLFDEPESGVDIENMAVIGEAARALLGPEPDCTCPRKLSGSDKSGLIITHTGHILNYIHADRGQIMIGGRLCCEGRPLDILEHIKKHGYQECFNCSDKNEFHPKITG